MVVAFTASGSWLDCFLVVLHLTFVALVVVFSGFTAVLPCASLLGILCSHHSYPWRLSLAEYYIECGVFLQTDPLQSNREQTTQNNNQYHTNRTNKPTITPKKKTSTNPPSSRLHTHQTIPLTPPPPNKKRHPSSYWSDRSKAVDSIPPSSALGSSRPLARPSLEKSLI